jgi:hypothetical protein
MRKTAVVMALCGLALIAAVGTNPRYLEELCIGGGLGDAADGGADFEADGDILTDGDIVTKGDVSAGEDGASNHNVSVTAGTGNDAALDLFESDANHGGAVLFDGGTDTLRIGTRDGSASVVDALQIEQGSSNVAIAGDVAVNGGDVTSSASILTLKPSGGGFVDVVGGPGKLRIFREAAADTSLDFYMWNAANSSKVFGEIFCVVADSTTGSEDGRFSLCLTENGTMRYNRFVVNSAGDGTFVGDVMVDGGSISVGVDTSVRGTLAAWDGAGGNAPGCIKLASPNGTVWYVFVEDDGTVKVNGTLPTQNSDGTSVGDQTD